MYDLTCEFCFTYFSSTRYNTKFCSPRCRTASHRAKKKAPDKNNWLTSTDAETRENFYLIRTLSSYSARLIEIVAETHGRKMADIVVKIAHAAIVNKEIGR